MKKLKIITIVGTRPEIIRLSRIINKLTENTDHYLVHTGQNYDFELNEIFFKDLKLPKPDIFLNSANNSKSPSNTIGNIITLFDQVLEKIKPDAILVLGDTNSCYSVIPAKKRKIPIFHIEAGNRCYDQRVPEEINRRVIDHISDINLTYSSISREYLINEGLPAERIIKVGSPMKEVINHYSSQINKSNILKKLKLKRFKYFVLSAHREENIEEEIKFNNLIQLINQIGTKFNLPIVFSLHPRTKNKIINSKINFNSNIKLIKPLGFSDYINLQINSKIVLSDSGTISEESSILNFPAINIRDTHERPEAMEEAAVLMTSFNVERVFQSINILTSQKRNNKRSIKIVSDYDCDNVSEKILRIIHSYTDYVKREVWKKY